MNLGFKNSPFINNKGELGSLKKNNLYKLMIHRLPNGYTDLYEFGKDVISLSDTVILYDRKDIREPYNILDEEIVNKCLVEYTKHSDVIAKLSENFNIPIFWYEEVYYEDGLKKLSDYLKIEINTKLKEKVLSTNKKHRLDNLKGELI